MDPLFLRNPAQSSWEQWVSFEDTPVLDEIAIKPKTFSPQEEAVKERLSHAITQFNAALEIGSPTSVKNAISLLKSVGDDLDPSSVSPSPEQIKTISQLGNFLTQMTTYCSTKPDCPISKDDMRQVQELSGFLTETTASLEKKNLDIDPLTEEELSMKPFASLLKQASEAELKKTWRFNP